MHIERLKKEGASHVSDVSDHWLATSAVVCQIVEGLAER
jgi:hypothetical protein